MAVGVAVIGWLVATGLTLLAAVIGFVASTTVGSTTAGPSWFVAPAALTAVGTAVCGRALDRRGHTRVSRSVLALGWTLAAYAFLTTAPYGLAPDEPITPWLISAAGGWYMMPILLCGWAAIVAAESLTEQRPLFRWAQLVPAGAVALAWLTGLGTIATEEIPVPAPLAGTPLGTPPADLVFGIATTVWMVSTALAPVAVFRAAARADGLRRNRLAIVGIAALAPLLTLVTCALLLVGLLANQLSDDLLAQVVLSTAFLLAPIVVAVGLLAACTARDDGVTGRIGTTARWVLRVLWFAVGAELAAVLAAVLGTGVGSPRTTAASTIAASTVAVVLTVGFVAAYRPVAGRLEAFMAAGPTGVEPEARPDPELAGPDAEEGLVGVLSPREREVLALIAQGRSNAAIAGELYLSERTIDTHVRSIFDKLGLGRDAGTNRRVQAAAAWIQADLARSRRVS